MLNLRFSLRFFFVNWANAEASICSLHFKNNNNHFTAIKQNKGPEFAGWSIITKITFSSQVRKDKDQYCKTEVRSTGSRYTNAMHKLLRLCKQRRTQFPSESTISSYLLKDVTARVSPANHRLSRQCSIDTWLRIDCKETVTVCVNQLREQQVRLRWYEVVTPRCSLHLYTYGRWLQQQGITALCRFNHRWLLLPFTKHLILNNMLTYTPNYTSSSSSSSFNIKLSKCNLYNISNRREIKKNQMVNICPYLANE